MNKREFLEMVVAGTMNDDVVAYATEALEKMDASNAHNREKAAEKRVEKEAERAPIRDAIVGVLTAEPKTATTLIAEAGVDIKPQAIPSLLKGLIESGAIVKTDVKVAGKGTQKGYALA